MHATSHAVEQQGRRLNAAEEQLFQRVRRRVETYFQSFEELEGFVVLGGNLQRLLSQVALELRRVFVQFRDASCQVEQLQQKVHACKQTLDRQRVICDQVLQAAQQVAFNAQNALDERTRELQAFYATQELLQQKQWTIQADERLQIHVQTLSEQHVKQLELLELEAAQRLIAMKDQLEAKKDAEIQFMRVQTRLQLANQVDRETRELLKTDDRRRRRHGSIGKFT
ncbi:hypothetical protein BBJ28_00006847 [Nothophytophthora sp. Chile5]|nr:hypothetical protein BBJ28_00006847 [Nothophytophthora sp. Chile5]